MYYKAVSFSNGNRQYVLFIKMLHIFGPSASAFVNRQYFGGKSRNSTCHFHIHADWVEYYASEMQRIWGTFG